MRRKRLCVSPYVAFGLFCLLVMVVLVASPGGAAAPAPSGEMVQSADSRAEGGSLVSASPQGFGLLDFVTVSPLLESRYATAPPAGMMPFPYRGLAANPGDMDFLADKPRSYLFSFDNGGSDSRYIGLARIDRLDLMQSNRTSPNEYGAELLIGYKVTDLWSVLFGKGMQLESPGDTSVHFQDDGWRFKFVKKFW